MNLCFISNFSKTKLFATLAKQLIANKIPVYWIACNRKLYDQLCQEFGADKVLLINRSLITKPQKPIAELKLNELVYGDRVLKHNYAAGLDFLTNLQRPVYDFIKRNNIYKVFGEITWAHELVIHRLCSASKELNCQYLNPHVIRIPNQRFAFFTDEKQSQILELNKPIIPHPTIRAKAPNYLKINKRIISKASSWKGKLTRVSKFLKNQKVDQLDPTLISDPRARIINGIKEEWQRYQYRKVKTQTDLDLNKMDYLFLGLHKQPEASVDVIGRYYEDQYQNIVNLWRALPHGWSFIIKEHAIAIGDRPLSFYKKLQALPGVILVNEQLSSYEFIKQAQLVATVSGTIAYEAALMGIPSVTLAPSFFNKINSCHNISLTDIDQNSLADIAMGLRKQVNNTADFSNYIMTHSFPGKVLDPISDPEVLQAANIDLLAQAFMEVSFPLSQALAV